MTRAQESEKEKTNGQNGTGYWVASQEAHELAPELDSHQVRRALAVMALTGNIGDAKHLYFAQPGSTLDGWLLLERAITPLRKFVLDGEDPYVGVLSVSQTWGVPTPAGDCAEDALPRELQNPHRAAEKQKFEKNKNQNPGETQE